MAIEQLLVRLRLESGQYKTEANQAAKATDKIATSAQTAGTATGGLTSKMTGLAATARIAVAGAAAAAVGSFVTSTVRAASDLDESINAVNKTFGSLAPGIHAIGEDSADSFGLAQSAFNDFAVRFSAFAKNIAEGSGRDVVDVVEEMTARVADFGSVHNLTMEEAASLATQTLAGETEAFRRFGGDVSAAAVEQKALELGLKGTNDELTEGEKQLVRYQLFMEQTDKTAGDFKDTQDGLANSTKTLNANLEDFKARVGQEFTPVVAEAAATGTQLLDILDPDVNLGWTQRLSAGIQLITGEGSEAVKTYIEQKTEINNMADAADSFAGETSRKMVRGQRDIRTETDETTEATKDQAAAFGDNERAIDRTVRLLGDYEDAQRRLTDPIFKAIDDQRNLAQAQVDYNAAVEEFGPKSQEAIDAGLDLAAAQQSVNDAVQDLPEDLRAGIDSIIILGRQAGVTEDSLAGIRAQIDAIDGQTAVARININVVGGERVQGDPRFDIVFRQHGGPLRAGQPAIVGEAGPELFVPQTAGMVISNQTLTSGRSGGVTNHYHFGAVYGYDDFMRKVNQANVDGRRLGIAN